MQEEIRREPNPKRRSFYAVAWCIAYLLLAGYSLLVIVGFAVNRSAAPRWMISGALLGVIGAVLVPWVVGPLLRRYSMLIANLLLSAPLLVLFGGISFEVITNPEISSRTETRAHHSLFDD